MNHFNTFSCFHLDTTLPGAVIQHVATTSAAVAINDISPPHPCHSYTFAARLCVHRSLWRSCRLDRSSSAHPSASSQSPKSALHTQRHPLTSTSAIIPIPHPPHSPSRAPTHSHLTLPSRYPLPLHSIPPVSRSGGILLHPDFIPRTRFRVV
jgi:hypothetical protein